MSMFSFFNATNVDGILGACNTSMDLSCNAFMWMRVAVLAFHVFKTDERAAEAAQECLFVEETTIEAVNAELKTERETEAPIEEQAQIIVEPVLSSEVEIDVSIEEQAQIIVEPVLSSEVEIDVSIEEQAQIIVEPVLSSEAETDVSIEEYAQIIVEHTLSSEVETDVSIEEQAQIIVEPVLSSEVETDVSIEEQAQIIVEPVLSSGAETDVSIEEYAQIIVEPVLSSEVETDVSIEEQAQIIVEPVLSSEVETDVSIEEQAQIIVEPVLSSEVETNVSIEEYAQIIVEHTLSSEVETDVSIEEQAQIIVEPVLSSEVETDVPIEEQAQIIVEPVLTLGQAPRAVAIGAQPAEPVPAVIRPVHHLGQVSALVEPTTFGHAVGIKQQLAIVKLAKPVAIRSVEPIHSLEQATVVSAPASQPRLETTEHASVQVLLDLGQSSTFVQASVRLGGVEISTVALLPRGRGEYGTLAQLIEDQDRAFPLAPIQSYASLPRLVARFTVDPRQFTGSSRPPSYHEHDLERSILILNGLISQLENATAAPRVCADLFEELSDFKEIPELGTVCIEPASSFEGNNNHVKDETDLSSLDEVLYSPATICEPISADLMTLGREGRRLLRRQYRNHDAKEAKGSLRHRKLRQFCHEATFELSELRLEINGQLKRNVKRLGDGVYNQAQTELHYLRHRAANKLDSKLRSVRNRTGFLVYDRQRAARDLYAKVSSRACRRGRRVRNDLDFRRRRVVTRTRSEISFMIYDRRRAIRGLRNDMTSRVYHKARHIRNDISFRRDRVVNWMRTEGSDRLYLHRAAFWDYYNDTTTRMQARAYRVGSKIDGKIQRATIRAHNKAVRVGRKVDDKLYYTSPWGHGKVHRAGRRVRQRASGASTKIHEKAQQLGSRIYDKAQRIRNRVGFPSHCGIDGLEGPCNPPLLMTS